MAVTADGRRGRLRLLRQDGAGVGPPRTPDGRSSRPRDQTIYTNAKVLLTGDSGAGKTGLAQRLIEDVRGDVLDGRRLGHAAQAGEDEAGPGRGGAGDLALGLRRAGRLPADPPALHGRDRPGRARLRPPEAITRSRGWPSGITTFTRAAGGGPSSSGSSPAGAIGAGCGSARSSVEEFQRGARLRGLPRDQRPDRRSAATSSARRSSAIDPLGPAAVDVVADGSSSGSRRRSSSSRTAAGCLLRMAGAEAGAGAADARRAVHARGSCGRSWACWPNAGVVWPLDFGDYVLLQPERINAYAGALVRAVRAHSDEIGCIAEADVLARQLLGYRGGANARTRRRGRGAAGDGRDAPRSAGSA